MTLCTIDKGTTPGRALSEQRSGCDTDAAGFCVTRANGRDKRDRHLKGLAIMSAAYPVHG